MKKLYLVCAALLWSMSACGADDAASPDEVLACDSIAYCSSYWNVGTQVSDLPPATGGTIASGTYVLNDVLAVETAFDSQLREVMLVDGDRYRSTELGESGTFSTSGSKITFAAKQACSYQGADLGASSQAPVTYDYAVDGNSLIIFNATDYSYQGQQIRVGLVFTRTTDLCNPGGSTTCTISTCYCAAATDSELTDAQCGG